MFTELTNSEEQVFNDLRWRGVHPRKIASKGNTFHIHVPGMPDFIIDTGYVEVKTIELTPAQTKILPTIENLWLAIVPSSNGTIIDKTIYARWYGAGPF